MVSLTRKKLERFEPYQYFKHNAELYAISGGFIPTPVPTPVDPEPFLMIEKYDTIYSYHCDAPRVEVKWGQQWPENMFCTNKMAGCSPVAAAQIMSYFEFPKSIKFTAFGDNSYTSLDWINIKKHRKSLEASTLTGMSLNMHYAGCEASESSHTTLAKFIRELGFRFNSDYDYDQSGQPVTSTYFDNAVPVIKSLLGNYKFSEKSSVYGVYLSLKDNPEAVAYCRGEGTNTGSDSGHAFVIDATGHLTYQITVKYNYNPLTGEYSSLEKIRDTDSQYVHCNWGYCGEMNGYFYFWLLNPDKGTETVPDNIRPHTQFSSRANYINQFRALIIEQ